MFPMMKRAGPNRPWAFPSPEVVIPTAVAVPHALTLDDLVGLAQERAQSQGLGTTFTVKSLFQFSEWERAERSDRVKLGIRFRSWVIGGHTGIELRPDRAMNNERQYIRL